MLERPKLVQTKPQIIIFSLNLEHRIFVFSYSPKALVERGQCGLDLPEERLELEALGKDVEKWRPGDLQSVVFPKTKVAFFFSSERHRPLSARDTVNTLLQGI